MILDYNCFNKVLDGCFRHESADLTGKNTREH